MSLVLVLVSISKSFAISLGVGSSTVAITHFFSAIADDIIDETERRMLGIAYVILRVAMIITLLSTIFLLTSEYSMKGITGISTFAYAELLVLLVLYTNALLMSARLVPSTLGPALQTGSWYTLGTLLAMQTLGLTHFTFLSFFMGYATWLILAIGIVNGIMATLKVKKDPS